MRVAAIWRSIRNMKATRAALLAAAIALAPPAIAAEPDDAEPSCRQLLPANPALRLGRVTGRGPVALLRDVPGCPGPAAACRSGLSVRSGATVLLGASRRDYICASRTGWIPAARVTARPADPTPPLAAWVGRWRLYDDKIVLRQHGDAIEAAGEAYWPAKNIMPANEGAFDGTAKPSENRLHFSDDQGCVLDMALVGPFLVVADNHGCGGHNVSFTGVFIRRGPTDH